MKFLINIAIVASFTSCEKEIALDLNSADPKMVIEGNITNEPGPYYVKLSNTINFSDANVYTNISGAIVVISDNAGAVDTLFQNSAGVYQTHSITGVPGNTYYLRVLVDSKSYAAASTMPYSVNLDSVRFRAFSNQGTDDFAIIPVYTDPGTSGNHYRFIQTVNGKRSESFNVQNDVATNGSVNQFPLFGNDEDEIKTDDTVAIDMMCIDENTYNYFYTLSEMEGGGFFGGTTPSNPPGNITGDFALGLFAAHTIQRKNTGSAVM